MIFSASLFYGYGDRNPSLWGVAAFLAAACFSIVARAESGKLPDTLDRIRASVVAIGTVQELRAPPVRFLGTGFVVGNGNYVITNAHVIPSVLSTENKEFLAVFSGRGDRAKAHTVEQVAVDAAHDLALLRLHGAPLPAVKLGSSESVREGQQFAFTGFPIGTVLGLYPVTHRAIVSAVTPIVIPAPSARHLNISALKALRNPFQVFQLDGTAYPGNSGSPLFHPETGEVVGIINMVFVKGPKESALSEPSGITYAIPGEYIRDLLKKQGL